MAARVALALAALALPLLVAEGVARWLGARAEASREEVALAPEIAALPALESVKDLSRPNVRGRHGDALFRTNRSGFRGPDYTPSPGPGVFRVVVAGDSYTMGWQIDEAEIYATRLAGLLDAAARPGSRFEVLNLGLGGLNVRQVMKRLVRVGLPYDPALLVYGFTLNDIFSADERPDPGGPEHLERLAEWLRFADSPSHLLRFLWPRWIALRNAIYRPEGSHELWMVRTYDRPGSYRRIEEGLTRFARIAERRGTCAVVLIHTDLAQLRFLHPFEEIYTKVAASARERGLFVAESFERHRGRHENDLRIDAVDSHPNAEGHRLLAETLFAELRTLPPRCGLPLAR